MSETNGNGNGHRPANLLPPAEPTPKRECGSPKRGGGICHSVVLCANGRCKLHGGKTLNGVAAPGFKHGRYSKYMPTHLRDRYNDAMNDPELTHLRSDISLIDALLTEKIQSLDLGESESLWLRAQELVKEYRDAHSASGDGFDGREPDVIFAELDAVLHSGQRRLDVFDEIQPILEQRRKTAESENKRLKDLNQTLTTEQAVAFVRLLADSVKRHVKDTKVVQAISDDFNRALSR